MNHVLHWYLPFIKLYSGRFWQASMVSSGQYIGFWLYFDAYKSRTIISRFSKRWMICNYNVECILTTLNDLYTIYDTFNALHYVELFVLLWIIYTYKVLGLLGKIWTVHWNFLLEVIPQKIASELSLPWESQQWTLSHNTSLLVKIPLVKIALQQIKDRLFLISKIMKIKVSGIGTL